MWSSTVSSSSYILSAAYLLEHRGRRVAKLVVEDSGNLMCEGKTINANSLRKLRRLLLAMLVVSAAISGFAIHDRKTAAQLAAQNAQIATVLSETRERIISPSVKLPIAAARSAQMASPTAQEQKKRESPASDPYSPVQISSVCKRRSPLK